MSHSVGSRKQYKQHLPVAITDTLKDTSLDAPNFPTKKVTKPHHAVALFLVAYAPSSHTYTYLVCDAAGRIHRWKGLRCHASFGGVALPQSLLASWNGKLQAMRDVGAMGRGYTAIDVDGDTSVAATPAKKHVKVEPSKSNTGKVDQQAAIARSPPAAARDGDLLADTIVEAVEGHLQEAAERAAISLLKERAKLVADRERSRVERELVQMWGVAGDLIGSCFCTYVPCPPPPPTLPSSSTAAHHPCRCGKSAPSLRAVWERCVRSWRPQKIVRRSRGPR